MPDDGHLSHWSLLHISDLHCEDDCCNRMKTVARRVGRHGIRLVVVSGDIIKGATNRRQLSRRYRMARKGLGILREELKLARDAFIFVPGNHDLFGDAAEVSERFGDYFAFVRSFTEEGRIPSADEALWITPPEEIGRPDQGEYLYHLAKLNITVLALNSVVNWRFHKRKKKPVDETAIMLSDDTLEWLQEKKSLLASSRSLKLAVMHNCPVPLHRPSATKPCRTLSNSATVLSHLGECRVSLVLHGDLHRSTKVAAARSLDVESWPIYTVGSGLFSGSDSNPGGQIYVLRMSIPRAAICDTEPTNCCQVEALDHDENGNERGRSQDTYALYLPIGDLDDSWTRGKGTVHSLELPENRSALRCNVLNRLLFSYRTETIERVRENVTGFLGDSPRVYGARILPDEMFTFLYQHLFGLVAEGEDGVFVAVHCGGFDEWIRNRACVESFATQQGLFNGHRLLRPTCRVVILEDKELSIARDSDTGIENLREFCKTMSTKTWYFPTFLSSRAALRGRYFHGGEANSEPAGIDPAWVEDVLKNTKRKVRDKRDELLQVDPGNIAVFLKSDDPMEDGVVRRGPAVAFYYGKPKDINVYRENDAYMSGQKEVIDLVVKCVREILSEEWQRQRIVAPCSGLTEAGALETLLATWPRDDPR